jgi:membrane associated rhomboid family serine protease
MIIILIALTSIVSFLAFSRNDLFDKLQFNAWYIKHYKEWYRFFSYALLHADWAHLIINMFVLWSFSSIVLSHFTIIYHGAAGLHFLLLYVGGTIFSTLYDFWKNQENIYYNAVGASGAVSAVVFASIILYPNGKIFFYIIPIGIPSWLFGILYLIYSAYMGKRAKDNIGHNAHFWGAIFGILYMVVTSPNTIKLFYNQLKLFQ